MYTYFVNTLTFSGEHSTASLATTQAQLLPDPLNQEITKVEAV